MPSAAQIAKFRAISSKKAAPKAANDAPPSAEAPKAKGRLTLPNIVATIFATDITSANDAKGMPYFALKGCEIDLGGGNVVTRTCMAFEAADLVKQVVFAGQDLTVTLQHTGSTMKIIGVLVDGEMKMVAQPLAKAA